MIKHTHKQKLMILKMVLENWGYTKGKERLHRVANGENDIEGSLYIGDWDRVNDLIDILKKREKTANTLSELRKGLNKDEMEEMNFLFKKYGGTRKTSFPWTA